ncbi:importin-7-like [Amblyomma americanum]
MRLPTKDSTSQGGWLGILSPASSASTRDDPVESVKPEQGMEQEQCPVDEYPDSKEVMGGIQNTDPMWFGALTSGTQSVEQKRSPQEVNVLTDQRKAATESRRIEKSGGYVFQNQAGPPPFRSGGTPFRQQLNFL